MGRFELDLQKEGALRFAAGHFYSDPLLDEVLLAPRLLVFAHHQADQSDPPAEEA